ncbi:glucosyltransferase domain-containing protein [Providencia rettgeri]|uniref:glucosyltransferase domain-containing protein n=1 Tax=Providencia rettgeri TaxID=587 RepID=UPI0015EC26A7|nr:glucosyltransferase domain-containing protein [Providencia rettgeri]QLR04787.1 glucosyltransferase domain-containing protein [Providencia rettgeri]
MILEINFQKSIRYYLLLLILLVFPIILANVYYIDDLTRATHGYTFWGIDGRPMSDIAMILFNFNGHLSDLAPLPLLTSCVMLAISFSIFRWKFLDDSLKSFIIPISFLFSPFIFEPLTYRFDSLTITFSIFFCFLFLFIELKNKIIELILSGAAICFVYSFYQPSINIAAIFISIYFFYLLTKDIQAYEIIKKVSVKLLSLIFGTIVYMLIILPSTHVNDNASHHPGISNSIMDTILNNANTYYIFFERNIIAENGKWLIIAFVSINIVSSIIISTKYHIRNISNSNKYVMLSILILSIIVPFLSIIASMGSLLFLSNSLETFARVYIGINAYFLLTIFLLYKAVKLKTIPMIISIISTFYIFTFVYSYGNSLNMQNDMNKNVAIEFKDATKNIKNESVKVIFNGESPKSPVFSNSSLNYPLLKTIVVDYYYNWLGPFRYMDLYGIKQIYPGVIQGELIDYKNNFCEFEKIYKSQTFSIYKKDDYLIVDFSNKECK